MLTVSVDHRELVSYIYLSLTSFSLVGTGVSVVPSGTLTAASPRFCVTSCESLIKTDLAGAPRVNFLWFVL